jgi:hypothetical protein
MSKQKDSPDIDYQFLLKIGIGITLIVLPIYFKIPYIIGFIVGMGLMAYLVLFPSAFGYMILSKLFPHAFSQFKVLQNEQEETEQKRKVKYSNK